MNTFSIIPQNTDLGSFYRSKVILVISNKYLCHLAWCLASYFLNSPIGFILIEAFQVTDDSKCIYDKMLVSSL